MSVQKEAQNSAEKQANAKPRAAWGSGLQLFAYAVTPQMCSRPPGSTAKMDSNPNASPNPEDYSSDGDGAENRSQVGSEHSDVYEAFAGVFDRIHLSWLKSTDFTQDELKLIE